MNFNKEATSDKKNFGEGVGGGGGGGGVGAKQNQNSMPDCVK